MRSARRNSGRFSGASVHRTCTAGKGNGKFFVCFENGKEDRVE
jgi:hypothetical protein